MGVRVRRRLVDGSTYVSLDDLLDLVRQRAEARRRRGDRDAAAELDRLGDDVVSAWLAGSVKHLEVPGA